MARYIDGHSPSPDRGRRRHQLTEGASPTPFSNSSQKISLLKTPWRSASGARMPSRMRGDGREVHGRGILHRADVDRGGGGGVGGWFGYGRGRSRGRPAQTRI